MKQKQFTDEQIVAILQQAANKAPKQPDALARVAGAGFLPRRPKQRHGAAGANHAQHRLCARAQ